MPKFCTNGPGKFESHGSWMARAISVWGHCCRKGGVDEFPPFLAFLPERGHFSDLWVIECLEEMSNLPPHCQTHPKLIIFYQEAGRTAIKPSSERRKSHVQFAACASPLGLQGFNAIWCIPASGAWLLLIKKKIKGFMLGLNGIIIDWSLPSKLKSIWINQLLNRKSLGSGQEANLRPCTLAGLYFALFLQTRWEIFSFLFFLSHTQKKTAFIETGSGSQVLRSPYFALPAEDTCQALQHPDGADQEFCHLLRALCWELVVPVSTEISHEGGSSFVPAVMWE